MIRLLLPVPGWLRGRGCQPEAYCHRAMLDPYLVDNGTKWQAVTGAFPLWDRVYAFFRAGPAWVWSGSSRTGSVTRSA